MSKASKSTAKGSQIHDDDGYPKQEVIFKLVSNIIQNNSTDTLVIFQWVDPSNQAKRSALNTDLGKDWVKGNDPKHISYTKDFPVALVNENFVKNLCSQKFHVIFVSKTEQKILDKVELHYSPLLFPTTDPKFEFFVDKLKVPNIESFKIAITANKPLLSPAYREHLNPIEICIMAAKNLPERKDKTVEYIPAYALCKFFDDTLIKTHSLPNSSKCKWMYKQVILLGLMNQRKLNEAFQTASLEFEIHDRDEVVKEKPPKKAPNVLIDIKYEDPDEKQEGVDEKKGKGSKVHLVQTKEKPQDKQSGDKKEKLEIKNKQAKDLKLEELIEMEDPQKIKTNNFGIVHFTLKQFLESDVTSLKLRKNITPQNTFKTKKINDNDSDSDSSPNKKSKYSSPGADYFEKESYLVVSFELAHPIGQANVNPCSPGRRKTQVINQMNSKKDKAVKPTSTSNLGNKTEEQEQEENLLKVSNLKFERAVYLLSTEFSSLRDELLNEIRTINLQALGRDKNDIYYLAFRALSDKEKNDKDFDIITGVEFIDDEYHLFILEGLAEKAMKKIGKNLPEMHPHSNEIRVLKNPEIKFEQRLYTDFNVDIKKVWLSKNLSELMCLPEIYRRSKVPEGVYQTLRNINELRKCYNLKMAVSINFFPLPRDIIATAEMYAEKEMYVDLKGNKTLPFKDIDMKSSSLCLVQLGPQEKALMDTSKLSEESNELYSEAFMSKSLAVSGKQSERQMIEALSLNIKKIINRSKFDVSSFHLDRDSFLSGPKFNASGRISSEIRSSFLDSISTSNRSSILNSDLYSPGSGISHRKNREKAIKEPRFSLKKDKIELLTHPKKPPQERIEDIQIYPWHVEKSDQEKRIKDVRGASLKSKEKQDFDISPRLKGQKHEGELDGINNYPWYVEKADQEKRRKTVRGLSLKSKEKPEFDLSPKHKIQKHWEDLEGTFDVFEEAEDQNFSERAEQLQGSPHLKMSKGLASGSRLESIKGKSRPMAKLAALTKPSSLAASPTHKNPKQQPLSTLMIEKYESVNGLNIKKVQSDNKTGQNTILSVEISHFEKPKPIQKVSLLL